MRKTKSLGMAVAMLFLCPGALAEDQNTSILSASPATTKILSNGVDSATVSIDSQSRAITVHLLTETYYSPPSVGITFYGDGSNPVTYTLHAMGLEGVRHPAYWGYFPGLPPHLGDTTESFIGIELSIPTAIGAPNILRPLDALSPVAPFWGIGHFTLLH